MDEQASKPRKDFFRYGCLAALVLLLMVVLGGLFGLYYAKRMFRDFTDMNPAVFPSVRLSRPEIDQLQQRIDKYRQEVRQGKTTEPLKLTADEINALIATDPDLKPLKGKLYVTISGKQMDAQLSVPMESVGLPLFRGRYLNGTGTFDILLHNGRLHLHLLSFLAKGRRIPEVYMDQIRKHDFAEGINNDPRTVAALDWLATIKVEDGKLTLVPKQKSNPQ
jgi:hypothetical protein